MSISRSHECFRKHFEISWHVRIFTYTNTKTYVMSDLYCAKIVIEKWKVAKEKISRWKNFNFGCVYDYISILIAQCYYFSDSKFSSACRNTGVVKIINAILKSLASKPSQLYSILQVSFSLCILLYMRYIQNEEMLLLSSRSFPCNYVTMYVHHCVKKESWKGKSNYKVLSWQSILDILH